MRAWLPSRRSTAHQRGALGHHAVRPGAVRQFDADLVLEGDVLLGGHARGLLDADHRVPLRHSLVCGVLSRAQRTPRRGRPNSGLAAAEKEEQLTHDSDSMPRASSAGHVGSALWSRSPAPPDQIPHPTTPIPVSPRELCPTPDQIPHPTTPIPVSPREFCPPPDQIPHTCVPVRVVVRTGLWSEQGCGPTGAPVA
jgi:hypothetical protein